MNKRKFPVFLLFLALVMFAAGFEQMGNSERTRRSEIAQKAAGGTDG